MEKFEVLTAIAAPLLRDNINTDVIIPAPWIVNFGQDLGKGLFAGWRYGVAGAEEPDFILNRSPYRDARILLSGKNFGCGSSREEAVWALLGFGVRCVIAPSFGDIFFENSFKNALLPVQMDAQDIAALIAGMARTPTLTVDLTALQVKASDGLTVPFGVQESRRQALLQGLDEVDLTLARTGEISAFQAADRVRRPWIYARQ